MGYPVRVAIEARVVEILLFEIIIRIDDWLHLVVVLHDVKPCEDVSLKLLRAEICGFRLHIKHGR
jgi:hypothetical protein